jgi:cell division protein FtsL
MSEFFTVKRIDNSRLVRPLQPNRMRECARLILLGGMLALCALLYAWQHFETIQLRYQLESLRGERSQAAELNQELKLEVAGLRSPGRIDVIARRQLGLTAPVPGQQPDGAIKNFS